MKVKSGRVVVKIDHSYIGDLSIDLVGPDAKVDTLLNATGPGKTIQIDRDISDLVRGRAGQGEWLLRIKDKHARDEGNLTDFSLLLVRTLMYVKASRTRKPGHVALLTIGTEVVSGEILNSNAQWLSEQLVNLRWTVTCHITVPDELPAMHAAFDFAASAADTIIVTGGLGPTRDDFTRNVVAEWVGLPLEFSEESWDACKSCSRIAVWRHLPAIANNVSFQKVRRYFQTPKGPPMPFSFQRSPEDFLSSRSSNRN